MSSTLREIEGAEPGNLQRLAHLLKGLSPAEVETLEILLDDEACETIARSLSDLREKEGIPIGEWQVLCYRDGRPVADASAVALPEQ